MRPIRNIGNASLAGLPLFLLALSVGRPRTGDPHADPRDQIWEILDHLGEGVLLVDDGLRPTLANGAARSLLGLRADTLPALIPSEEIVVLADRSVRGGTPEQGTVELWFPQRSTLDVKVAPMRSGGVVITLRDVTDEHLAQRVRKEFVSHASHELKSPVASMQTLAEAIGRAVADDPDSAARFAVRLAAESERVGRLIADLLDLSRLEDPVRAPMEKVDLAEVIRNEMEACRPQAEVKGIRLSSHLEDGPPVAGDAQQLGSMVRNLLDNAIRYTSPGGGVDCTLSAEGDVVGLRVADDGMGIAREAQSRVFERFYRVDRARSRDRGGTGLGLAIVKHVAELHGGSVAVESELGRGSTFTVSLPADRDKG